MVINLQRPRRRPSKMRASDRKGAERYRCFLNGEEVTDRCFYVDSRRGVVRLYLRDEDGLFYIRQWPSCGHRMRVFGCECWTFQTEVATEERRGRVKLTRRAQETRA